MTAALEARSLVAGYGPEMAVVRNLSLEVQPGEVVALLGPNGAGKTTTIMTLCGELPALAGEVHLHGQADCQPALPAGTDGPRAGRGGPSGSGVDVAQRQSTRNPGRPGPSLSPLPRALRAWKAPGGSALGRPTADAGSGHRAVPPHNRAACRRALTRAGAHGRRSTPSSQSVRLPTTASPSFWSNSML